MRVLIIGCGYVGLAVAERFLSQGHTVIAMRRTRPENLDPDIHLLQGDITQPESLQTMTPDFDWVINTVSSSRGGSEEYRAVYLEGTRNIINWLQDSPLQKFVYTSSTSVYGQVNGEYVTENSPTSPQTPTSQILVETEQLILEKSSSGFPGVILRVSGIYGPERGHLFHQYLGSEAKISGSGDRLLNMIHRDDLAGIIEAALTRGIPGNIYNATDSCPVTQLEFFQWLSQELKKPLPPVETEPLSSRKRATTSKRVSNQRLAELGYLLRYPTFREGYAEEIRRALRRNLN
ncbi:MAG: SDR family oxidoreductase [Verrucomicrobiota bacterium]|nr:SDR family oxidoreductase [Verrucomicrobiota bacterium]